MNDAIIGFAGVLVGVVATLAKDVVSYWIRNKKAGRYAAVRIVCILDEYVEKCVEVVHDDGTMQGQPAGRTDSGEEYRVAQVDSPEPPEFPDDIDWNSINPNLMYRILALPNIALGTQRFISAASEDAFPPDYDEFFRARWEGYADLGLEALSISTALRSQFNLPLTSIEVGNPNWDAARFFRKKKEEVDILSERESASTAEMWDRLNNQNATAAEKNGGTE